MFSGEKLQFCISTKGKSFCTLVEGWESSIALVPLGVGLVPLPPDSPLLGHWQTCQCGTEGHGLEGLWGVTSTVALDPRGLFQSQTSTAFPNYLLAAVWSDLKPRPRHLISSLAGVVQLQGGCHGSMALIWKYHWFNAITVWQPTIQCFIILPAFQLLLLLYFILFYFISYPILLCYFLH